MAMRNLNLLIVDDDASIVRIIETYLKKDLPEGLDVTAVTDPREAQAWLDNHSCDILLSDIEMPELNGLDMLRFARRRNAWTQVIFLTGHSTSDRIAEAIENGASDYLLKPINREELRDVITQTRTRMIRWQHALQGTFRAMAST